MARGDADGKDVANGETIGGEGYDAAIAKRRAQDRERQRRHRAQHKATRVLQSDRSPLPSIDRSPLPTMTAFGNQENCGQGNHGTSAPCQMSVLTSIFYSAMQPLRDIMNIITDGNVSLERFPIPNMTPFGNQTIFGEGNHGTSTPWQMSILTDSPDNSTRRPLHDITNIVTRGVILTNSTKRPPRDVTNLRIAGIFEFAGPAQKYTFQPSALSMNIEQTPFSGVTELEQNQCPRQRITVQSVNSLDLPGSSANIDQMASDKIGDVDENWLHRNDNWQPRLMGVCRDGNYRDGVVDQSLTPEELKKAKRCQCAREYRLRQKEELAIARQIQNGDVSTINLGNKRLRDFDADMLLQKHASKLAKN
ncbi:hypothetical protein EJB05_51667 [Eragrostis curvula]|uniref:BZIP domain-containing protein n=1 Tax=Eragrostis curvula TaxID=38414 RepID=A0A5J9SV41_9POAL|nr:hypothetical protein EJB05_51667 [Eragrostis curvula]